MSTTSLTKCLRSLVCKRPLVVCGTKTRNMKKIFKLLFFIVILTTSCDGQEDEAKLVKEAFDNYKSAILNDKGDEAVKYVDSRTIKYYQQIVDLVKNADSAEVVSLPLIDKLMVFSIRHRTSKEEILSFDGKGLLVYAIKSGMVGKNSVANNSIGEVSVDNNFAKGQFIANGQKAPFYFHFYKEDSKWKIDLTSIFSVSNMAVKKMIEESEQDENEFFFSLLENLTGEYPGKEIWKKVN
jgi:hypothetical protein